MAYDSENHDYEIPNLGEENWGDEVQRTLEAIDADVIIKDTSGNRPNDPPENSWFLDETNDVLERYDGSSWHIIGGLGSDDKPLPSVTTDEVTGPGRPYSTEDDLSDVSVHFQRKSSGTTTEFTLLDVSDGPKSLIFGAAVGHRVADTAGNNDQIGPVTVDGTATSSYPSSDTYIGDNSGGTGHNYIPIYPIHYDSSLKIEWEHTGSGNDAFVVAYIAGSGPHTAAIVTDGEPVYSVHRNLSDEQIDGLAPPDGYKVVKNPDLSHRDPMVRGAWDDANGAVVDHPYWADFHDALDAIRVTARQFGPREMLKNVDTPADRGAIPFETPDPSDGTATPDPSDTSSIQADAMAFEKARWDAELPVAI